MDLFEFFIKYFEIIMFFTMGFWCLFIGHSIGHHRTYEEDKKLKDYYNLKRENEILKDSISIKKKRK